MTYSANPLLQAWTTPHGLPPFAAIRTEHYAPAFDAALAEAVTEIEAIAANPAAATFDNTIVALETLRRDPQPHLRRVLEHRRHRHDARDPGAGTRSRAEADRARHEDLPGPSPVRPRRCSRQGEGVARAHNRAGAGAGAKYMRAFIKSGARLDDSRQSQAESQRRTRLDALHRFQPERPQRRAVLVDGPRPSAISRASTRASAPVPPPPPSGSVTRPIRDHAVALIRRAVPRVAERRDLRETGLQGVVSRGANGGDDRQSRHPRRDDQVARGQCGTARLPDLRRQRPRIHDGEDAGERAANCSTRCGSPRGAAAIRERDLLQAQATADGGNFRSPPGIGATTPRRCARRSTISMTAEVKPYLSLERMIEASFDCATRLFGLSFKELKAFRCTIPRRGCGR